jgi:hypothetical protein
VVILYLETNFLLSLALKQDPEASAILEEAARDKSLGLAIPQVCIMEAVATVERRVEERTTFHRRIQSEIKQLERSKTVAVARQLLDELNQALITNEEYTNRILYDFQEAVDQLASVGQLFPLGMDALNRSFVDLLIKTKRERLIVPDNLIICSILENAMAYPSETKAFLSGNTKDFGTEIVLKALKAVGVEKYFAEARNFLGWYGSLPKPSNG